MNTEIMNSLKAVLERMGFDAGKASLEHPAEMSHGDWSTNAALIFSKESGTSPRDLAQKIVEEFKKDSPKFVVQIEIAGPGFINFFINDEVYTSASTQSELFSKKLDYGKGKNILIEYTDPNTFKVFHIGHLMANAIGESLSRIIEHSGASVTRICYPSDIGLHIAKSIWAWKKHKEETPAETAPILEKTAFLGKMYVEGTAAYDENPATKSEIDALNISIYDKNDKDVNDLYSRGRRWSLDHFEMLYKRLGTSFNDYIYESDAAPLGWKIVKEYIKKGIFEESEGAIVFKGEKYGLHTRVFINAHGLPTYEAKEIGLNSQKFKKYPKTDESIIVTANEQNDYFKVVKKALSLIDESVGSKTVHIGHGLLRTPTGKMSSRTGKVITAEALIEEISDLVRAKIADRGFSQEETAELTDSISIAAIKYSILRQSIGGDVIFDKETSISFEGDSGPYLQYSAVRANTLVEKAREAKISEKVTEFPEKASELERLIVRFSEVSERARKEYAPQHVVQYLTHLASVFNSWYASQLIIDLKDSLSPYRVAVTKSFATVMKNGLWLLGIKVPQRM